MATRFSVLASCLPLLLTTGACAVPVPNSGFEDGDAGGDPPGWTFSLGEGGRGTGALETETVHSGAAAYRVTKRGVSGYTMLSSQTVPVQAGKSCEVSAWVRAASNVRGGVYFMIMQYPAGSDAEQLPNTFSSVREALPGGVWCRLRVRVAVREGNDRIRINCIQAFNPSEVIWDDFAVAESDSGPSPRYEPASPEPLPELAPAMAIVRQRQRASAEVRVVGGRPRLFIDDRMVPWTFYVGPFWNPADAQIADFRDAGVRVYLVPLVLGRDVYEGRGPWLGAGRYDFSEVDDLLWRVLRVDPLGYVIFYMACDPYRAWGEENPDDVTWDQHGQRAIVEMHPKRWGDDPSPTERFGPSALSPRTRGDIAQALRELARHVEQSEAGKAVIGYHVAGFNDGQWFAWERLAEDDLHLADYSPGAREGFQLWLRRQYGDDVEALRQAWGRPDVDFASASVPPAERLWSDGFLVDARTEQDIADYVRFYSEGVAETVGFLASVLKEETGRRIICGTYYEDITCNSANHIALARHLRSDSIDYLAGPAAYGIRMPGYPGAVRSVFASTLMHGKVYLTEQDWRSFRSAPNGPDENFEWGRAETAEAHNAMVRRECGMMLAFGLGTWWYDMGGGWFRDDGIMSGIAEAVRAFQRDLEIAEPPEADLAVIVSEESNHYIRPKRAGFVRWHNVVSQIEQLNTSGVPYRLYLQSDLGAADMPDHRAYLFLNSYYLTKAQRDAIERLKSEGRTLVFVHAPGVVGAPDPAAAVSRITGMSVRQAEGVRTALAEGIESDHPLLARLDGAVNVSQGLGDLCFEVVDAEAEPLASYVGTDTVAAAVKEMPGWRSVLVGVPLLTDRFVHNLAGWAGCWRAGDPGDAVYANDHFVTIHAVFPGRKVLRARRPSRFVDLTSGEVIAEGTDSIEIDMARGETRWFATEPTGTGDRKMLRAGFARADVTPEVGLEIPGGFYEMRSTGVHDRLYAEAAVFANENAAVALVGVDSIMVPRDVVETARAEAEKRTGIPAANIMIAASHTHTGGPIVGCFGSTRNEAYCQMVAQRIAEAVTAAHHCAVPARVAVGVGHEDSVSFNRRFRMRDGTVKTHPGKMNPDIVEPEGPIDPDVVVIAAEDTDGRLLGCIVNFACHATTLGGLEISADWIAPMRATVRSGAQSPDMGVVFLNGACGDVTQVDNRSAGPPEFGEWWCRRVGMTIGAEVLKVLARAEFREHAIIGATHEVLDLPIRDLPESDAEVLAREAPAYGLGADVEDVYIAEARAVREMRAESPTVTCEVQGIRIGQAGIAANPSEYFCALGLDIKARSPLCPTMVVELANGCLGYVPTAEAFKGGGYETRTARSSYLAASAGAAIADASVRVLRELARLR